MLMPALPSCAGSENMKAEKSDASIFDRFSIDFGTKYGEGGYGATFAAADKGSGEKLAVKIIDTRRMKMDAIQKECHILETLTHPNIIHVKGHGLGVDKHAHLYFIFMEVASGGELFDQVINRGANAMPEEMAREFFCQLLDGVAYCHLAGVAHRDLKLENVLLTDSNALKLIDFGLSHVYPRLADKVTVDRSKPLRDVCGSKSYAAPEVLASKGYDGFAADMWSIGVCLFAMLSGFFPLDEAATGDWRYPKLCEAQALGRSSTAVVYGWYKRSARHLSPEVVHLLDGLLAIDANKRLSMEAVRSHPWVGGKKFGGAGAADQGSYNASGEVGEEGPAYRGGGGVPKNFEDDMVVDEDDAPVYRSLSGVDEPQLAPMPGLKRQRAQLNLLEEPMSGMAALDALINEP